jgi:hypothetical protein
MWAWRRAQLIRKHDREAVSGRELNYQTRRQAGLPAEPHVGHLLAAG